MSSSVPSLLLLPTSVLVHSAMAAANPAEKPTSKAVLHDPGDLERGSAIGMTSEMTQCIDCSSDAYSPHVNMDAALALVQ